MTEKIINTTVTSKDFLKVVDNIILNNVYYNTEEETEDGLHLFGFEIYVDYREPASFSENSLKKVLENNEPEEYFEELLLEWAEDNKSFYYLPDLEDTIKKHLTEEQEILFDEVYYDEVQEYLNNNCQYYYDRNDFLGEKVCVNILVDVGNKNYDYACDINAESLLESCENTKYSSLYWLARQNRQLTKLKKDIKRYFKSDVSFDELDNKFTKSVCQELINLCGSYCHTLTFCLEMTIEQLLRIITEQKKQEPEGYIVIDKSVPCGLFNTYSGGGSLLEIEPLKDTKLPIKYIGDIQVEDCKFNSTSGYTVDHVYGLCRSFWEDGLKKIKI